MTPDKGWPFTSVRAVELPTLGSASFDAPNRSTQKDDTTANNNKTFSPGEEVETVHGKCKSHGKGVFRRNADPKKADVKVANDTRQERCLLKTSLKK